MRNAVTVSLIALLLTACMVGPDYSRPSVDIPSAWRVSDQDAKRLANLTWWEAFNDPVLNQLVTDALHENKDLQIASARMEEYAARYGVSRADLFPQVGAGADAYRQKNTLPGTNLKGSVITSYSIHYTKLYEGANRPRTLDGSRSRANSRPAGAGQLLRLRLVRRHRIPVRPGNDLWLRRVTFIGGSHDLNPRFIEY